MSAARSSFDGLFPLMGPWARAALWCDAMEVPVPTTPVEPELPFISRQRLTPLLMRYIDTQAPKLSAAIPVAARHNALQLIAVSSLVLAHGSAISQGLRAAGIPNVAVKGPAIAVTYPSWRDRPYADLDLYVEPQHFRHAMHYCLDLGMTEDAVTMQPHPWFDRHCRESVNLISTTGVSVDLHHHVPPWRWGSRLTGRDLISRGTSMAVLGHPLVCASIEDNLLIAALHVVSDKNSPGGTLLIWRDLVQLAAVTDVAVLRARAAGTGLTGWLRGVLSQLPEAVRPRTLIDSLHDDDSLPGRRRLEFLLSDRPATLGVMATQSLRLPAARVAAYAAGMLFPSSKFLERSLPGERHRRIAWWRVSRRRPT